MSIDWRETTILKFGGFSIGRLHISPWLPRRLDHFQKLRVRRLKNAWAVYIPGLSIYWELAA